MLVSLLVWLAEQKPLEIVKPKWQSVAIRKYNPVGKKKVGGFFFFFFQDFFSFLIVKRNQNFVFLMR